MTKSLDRKLERIRAGLYTPSDFIIADAKDGDMGFGLTAPGPRRGADGTFTNKLRTRAEYLDAMRAMVRSAAVDIMLTSASVAETLAGEGLYDESPVTPAIRLNDTTDIWNCRHTRYLAAPSRPFRSARPAQARAFADLGLYSVTFSNDVERDLASLEAYAEFRQEATAAGMRHFLEVFNPNPLLDIGVPTGEIGNYVNDCIVRGLAGVVSAERPAFLKIAYNGPRAMEELAAYDPSGLIVGILGGAKGTTRDTFELISQAERYGARVALFGRKINLAESPDDLVALMRQVVAGAIKPVDAVDAYHHALAKHGIRPDRALEDDRQITDPVLAHG